MGSALLEGALNAKMVQASEVWGYDPFPGAAEALSERLGIQVAQDNRDLAAQSDLILLACKPYQVVEILQEIKDLLTEDKLILSIAAGITIPTMQSQCPDKTKIIRIMPNTPSLITQGASGIAAGAHATEQDLAQACKIMKSVGLVEVVDEDQLDAVTSLSGSGPAYIYTLIESLAGQAQQEGLSADAALRLATQTVIGAGKMVEATGMSPAELRNQVTSPGGTTLAGLEALSANGFESSIKAGVHAAAERSREIARES